MPTIGQTELIIILIILFFSLWYAILPVIAFWKICDKAGLNGALGLLMLVPIVNVILPLYVAFTKWPVLEQKPNENT